MAAVEQPGADVLSGPWALKEWASVIALLLAGRTQVVLRKGGIHEKDFGLPARSFYLWPTYLHQHAAGLRPEFADAAMSELHEAPTGEGTCLRARCDVLDVLTVPDAVAARALAPFHPYTDEQINMRLQFRPRKVLTALVVRVQEVDPPRFAASGIDPGGCRSWLELPGDLSPLAPSWQGRDRTQEGSDGHAGSAGGCSDAERALVAAVRAALAGAPTSASMECADRR